jgi:ribosomal protein S18 acetylase RimI-like enzyme
MTTTDVKPAVHIRWMIRRDFAAVLPIDQHGTGSTWDEADFLLALQQRDTIGMVAEDATGEIVGYMVYSLSADRLDLHKLAVRRDVWGNGYGSRLLEKFAHKLHTHRRPFGSCRIPEHNLPAHLLFRSCGWRCVAQVGGLLEFRLDGGQD